MVTRFLRSATTILFLASTGILAANGFSATVTWRQGCYNWQGLAPESQGPGCTGSIHWGNLVKYSIQNNQVSSVDTLVSIGTALCQYPGISLDGKKIAFFRWRYYADGATLKQSASNKNYISVFDLGTRQITDLVDAGPDFTYATALDWPADGWIYYVKSRPGSAEWDRYGNELWKINPYAADPASTNQLAVAFPTGAYFRRFSLNLAANKMAVQTYCMPNQTCNTINMLQCFPPTGYAQCQLWGAGGCNIKVSASGSFTGHFGGGTHDAIGIMGMVNGEARELAGYSVFGGAANIWDADGWAGWDFGSEAGVDMLVWSANSDKWICENVYYYYSAGTCGMNQLLINWWNKQAIVPTRLPKLAKNQQILYGMAGVGDFWVQPPSGYDYAYEDTAGGWHQLSKPAGYGSTVSQEKVRMPALDQLRISIDAPGVAAVELPQDGLRYRVSVIDMAGRPVVSQTGRGAVTIGRSQIPRGACVIRIEGERGTFSERVVLGR